MPPARVARLSFTWGKLSPNRLFGTDLVTDEGGAPRSESRSNMIAGGNHTAIQKPRRQARKNNASASLIFPASPGNPLIRQNSGSTPKLCHLPPGEGRGGCAAELLKKPFDLLPGGLDAALLEIGLSAAAAI